jgi:anti-sigma regulatory factor (Ser/Thr protein kinase)
VYVFEPENDGGVRAGVMTRQARGGGPMTMGASPAKTAQEVPEATRTTEATAAPTAAVAAASAAPDRPEDVRLECALGRADLRGVPQARRAVRELLRHWGRPGRSEVAELLTSELVTNALVHTDREAVLTAVVSPHGLRVEVRDFAGRRPLPRPSGPGPESEADAGDTGYRTSGRGLVLVQSLADAWGVRPHGVGKSVWFELDGGAA